MQRKIPKFHEAQRGPFESQSQQYFIVAQIIEKMKPYNEKMNMVENELHSSNI